jgi:hypothetical protein
VCVELGGRRGRRGACSSHPHTHTHTTLVAHARCERAPIKRPPLATAPQAHVFRSKDQQLTATVGQRDRPIQPSLSRWVPRPEGALSLLHTAPRTRQGTPRHQTKRAWGCVFSAMPNRIVHVCRTICNRWPYHHCRPPAPQRGRKGSPWLLVDP